MDPHSDSTPLLTAKDYTAPAVFEPTNLLREARRQRGLAEIAVPAVSLLDPDGDIVRYLAASGSGRRHSGWACYHTEMWTVDLDGIEIGVVGMAVGAPFAVLVAEQLAASGTELILSITSAGQIAAVDELPCFVLIEKALRDEGTSLHYQPPGRWSRLDDRLQRRLAGAFDHLAEPYGRGRPGPPTLPTARQRTRSKRPNRTTSHVSKWKLPAYTPMPRRVIKPWCASPTSPTRWPPQVQTSKKAPTTARTTHSLSLAPRLLHSAKYAGARCFAIDG